MVSQNQLRVVLFTDSDVFAGTERHMLDLARGLYALDVAVTVACPSPAALEEAARRDGLPVLAIPKQELVDWNAARVLAKRLKSGETDIIHAHNGRTALAAALAVRLAGRGRCVMTQHFLKPNHAAQQGPKAAVSRAAHHWVVGQISRILAISEAVRQAMLARGEAPDSKITVVPNGISAPSSGNAAETRQSLGIGPNTPLVVCAARLEREKDIASLVTAMQSVRKSIPEARCLIAGEGSQKADLKAQIESLELLGTVTLLGFRSDATALMAAADVFVLPSLAEPFGLVLLEAMALGRPVIATRAGGPLEIVVEGQTGFLIPPSSPEALAAAIIRLLANPAVSHQLGANGLARYQALFTASRMAEATKATYEQVMHS
ncbi:MAG: glycosyltransferase family 4 protein [Janthinobacterium lividum]